jgi:hypothetical protein
LGGQKEETMSIADRVIESIDKYNSNDLENALIQACIAIDGTSKKEFPGFSKQNKKRFKSFISANIDIITFFTCNTNVFVNCQFREYTIEQFIYEVIRCSLLHEGELSARFKFTEPNEPVLIGATQWCFPKTFIFGVILAVIGASSNANQKVADYLSVSIMDNQFRINDLWGRGDLIRKAIGPPVSNE